MLGPPKWKLVEKLEPQDAQGLLEKHLAQGPELLGSKGRFLPYKKLVDAPARSSLAIIEPSGVSWQIGESYSGTRQTRVKFRHGKAIFNLPVTDPVWEQKLADLALGTHPRNAFGGALTDRLIFTISLGEPYFGNNPDGECYKLVAGVIVLPGEDQRPRRSGRSFSKEEGVAEGAAHYRSLKV